MPRRPKTVPGIRVGEPPEKEKPQFSVSELRAMLIEAEAREQSEVERLRAEVDRLRAEIDRLRGNERLPAIMSNPAVRLPRALQSMASSLPPVLTIFEAAEAFRVSAVTIRNWIKSGKLMAGQSGRGGHVRIPRDAALALLASMLGQSD